jgi:hypothetical protein
MASARTFRNRHVLGGCDSDMGCITQRVGDPLRAEPFMPGTHRTSTYSSRGIRTALGSSGALMQQGFVGRLAVSCKIRTRSFDERPASAGNSPASTPGGRNGTARSCLYRMWTLVRACAGPICVTHLAPVGPGKVALRVSRSSFKCQHIH